MHYRNGRDAANGDKIISLAGYGSGPVKINAIGILFDAVPGNDFCNGSIASIIGGPVVGACLCDCLHLDDLAEILKEKGLDKRPDPNQKPDSIKICKFAIGDVVKLVSGGPEMVVKDVRVDKIWCEWECDSPYGSIDGNWLAPDKLRIVGRSSQESPPEQPITGWKGLEDAYLKIHRPHEK